MADPVNDNPAGRLYEILIRIRAVVGSDEWRNTISGTSVPAPEKHRVGLIAVLSPGQHPSGSALARLISAALSLPDETFEELGFIAHIVDIDLITQWRERISTGLEGFFYRSMTKDDMEKQARESDMAYIALCSDLLHKHRHEVEIEQEKLVEIRAQIQDILQEVDDDLNFDNELRNLLVSHLREMLAAIDSLPTWGTARLQAAVAETVGDLAVHWQVVTSKSGNSPDTWVKVTSVLAAVTAMFSFGSAIFQSIEAPAAAPALPAAQVQIVNQTPTAVIQIQPASQH
jgi:hypothetical protein